MGHLTTAIAEWCGTVIAGLEALVAEPPYREPVWAQLITAYYVAGRR